MLVMFGTLLILGGVSFRVKPPLPERVVYELDGGEHSIFAAEDIHAGRDVWRTLGGMEMGSVWGHGSYLAPNGLLR